MSFLLTNDKGLFADLTFRGLVTDDGLVHLMAQRAGMTPEEKRLLDEVLPVLERLPRGEGFFFFGPNDSTAPKQNVTADRPYGYGRVACRGWYVPDGFQGKSSQDKSAPSDQPADLGWDAIPFLTRVEKPWNALLERHGLTVGYQAFQGVATLPKRSASWRFIRRDSTAAFGAAQACALFLPRSNGYLNDKGAAVALAGARLFESAEAARRTRNSRRLKDAVVVEVETRVLRLAPGETPPTDTALSGVLAQLAAQDLDGTLPSAADAAPARAGRRQRM